MKKLIGILIASLMIVQSFAVFAAETYYDPVYVDGALRVRNGDSDGDYQDSLTTSKRTVDYFANLDLQNAEDEYKRIYEQEMATAEYYDSVLPLGYAQVIKDGVVSGYVEITLNFPTGMTVPESLTAATGMDGFVDYNPNSLYVETAPRTTVTNEDGSTTVTIKADIRTGITAEELYVNREAYFADLDLEIDNVTIASKGKYEASGTVHAYIAITTDVFGTRTETRDIDIFARGAGTVDEIFSATVTIRDNNTTGGGAGGGSNFGTVGSTTTTPTAEPTETSEPVVEPTPLPTAPPAPPAQLDSENHFAYIIGYPEGDVRPQNNISREEVSTIFFRLLTDSYRSEVWSETNNFSDVPSDLWSNNAISTMANAGILTGDPNGKFRPGDNITRAEFATIAARFDSEPYSGEDKFDDISGHWAAEYINKAAVKGWISGDGDGTFRPDDNITRAEAFTLVNNVLNRHVLESGLLDDMVKWSDNRPDQWYYTAVQEATNSHYYDRPEDAYYETWTEIREPRDWAQLEK